MSLFNTVMAADQQRHDEQQRTKRAPWPAWKSQTDDALRKYAEIGHALRYQEINLAELEERKEAGRRITGGCEPSESQRQNNPVQWEETIVCAIADAERKIRHCREYREAIEQAVAFGFDTEHQNFIVIYWWSGLSKRDARDMICFHSHHMTDRTFYFWRDRILERMARLLGLLT